MPETLIPENIEYLNLAHAIDVMVIHGNEINEQQIAHVVNQCHVRAHRMPPNTVLNQALAFITNYGITVIFIDSQFDRRYHSLKDFPLQDIIDRIKKASPNTHIFVTAVSTEAMNKLVLNNVDGIQVISEY